MTELDYRTEIAETPAIPRRGWLPVFGAVMLVMVLLGSAVGLRWYFALPARLANVRPVAMELRLAETAPAAGLTLAPVQGSSPQRYVYLHPEAVVTNAHLVSAEAVHQQGGVAIELRFNPAGTLRMQEATAAHRGKPLAILIDGQVRSAPIIHSQIGAAAVIEGNFTEEEAERIAAGLLSR